MYKGRRLRKLVAVKSLHGLNTPAPVQESVKATHVAVTPPVRAHASAVPTFERLPVPVAPTPVPILEEDFELDFDNNFEDGLDDGG